MAETRYVFETDGCKEEEPTQATALKPKDNHATRIQALRLARETKLRAKPKPWPNNQRPRPTPLESATKGNGRGVSRQRPEHRRKERKNKKC